MNPVNGGIIKGFEHCPKCNCDIVVRRATGMSIKIARAYAMAEHNKAIHNLRWNQKTA